MLKPSAKAVVVSLTPWEGVPEDELQQWESWVAVEPEWQSAFLSPVFAGAVHSAMGGVHLLRIHDQEGLRALMPLRRMSGPWGRFGLWEPAGGVMSDRVALVHRIGAKVLSLEGLLASTRVGTLFYTHVEQADAGAFAPDPLHPPRVGLRIRIDDFPDGLREYEAALAERDPKLVADTERRERKLRKDYGEIVFAYRSAFPERDLQALLKLKCDQYARTGAASPLSVPGNEKLLYALLKQDNENCGVRLSTLHCGDRLVAAHMGLKSGPVLHYWFPVYDQAFKAYSPGRLLLLRVMRSAFEEGVRCIDRGEGDSQAKRDFANESHRFVRGAVCTKNTKGRLSKLALALQWRLGVLQAARRKVQSTQPHASVQ